MRCLMKAWPTRLDGAVRRSARRCRARRARRAGRRGSSRPGASPAIASASSAVMKSPGTNSPSSSTKKQRSASPSQAMPRSAPSRLTLPMMNARFSSSSGFGWWCGKVPSGSKWQRSAWIGSRGRIGASIVPAMPFAPSSTTFSGAMAERRRCSAPSPRSPASTSRVPRLPGAAGVLNSPASGDVAHLVEAARRRRRGSTPRRTIFMPLYCAGLCDAVTIRPPS